MKEFKGTKGKWELNPLRDPANPTYWCLYTQDGADVNHIAVISEDGLNKKEEAVSNAQLIAAAPELLEALQETDKDLCVLEGTMFAIEKKDPRAEGMMEMVRKWRKRNQEAINKALGE